MIQKPSYSYIWGQKGCLNEASTLRKYNGQRGLVGRCWLLLLLHIKRIITPLKTGKQPSVHRRSLESSSAFAKYAETSVLLRATEWKDICAKPNKQTLEEQIDKILKSTSWNILEKAQSIFEWPESYSIKQQFSLYFSTKLLQIFHIYNVQEY